VEYKDVQGEYSTVHSGINAVSLASRLDSQQHLRFLEFS
jgi:hypothetical protein